MNSYTKLIIFLGLQFFTINFSYSQNELFGAREDLGTIENKEIDEASGIAESRLNPGIFWTHNDGDEGKIYAFWKNGQHLAEYKIDSKSINDLEDIAIGPGPVDGRSYIYIGDIGDNSENRKHKYIYRISEPEVKAGQKPFKGEIKDFDLIEFSYPDGNKDSEALLIDPLTKDIYLISKRDKKAHIYRLKYPQDLNTSTVAELMGEMQIGRSSGEASGITGGDISPNGKEILIKDYFNMYYYSIDGNESVSTALKKKVNKVNYDPEPQGEAVCWGADGSGYYVVSEEIFNIQARLSFYPKIKSSIKKKSKMK